MSAPLAALVLLAPAVSPVPGDSPADSPAVPSAAEAPASTTAIPPDSANAPPGAPAQAPASATSTPPGAPAVPPDPPAGASATTAASARAARRVRFVDAAPLDILGAGARARGGWAAGVQLGWPWFGLRAQVGVARRLALLVEVETALARRWRPAVGVSLRWVDREHFRLGGELLLGWLVQGEPLVRRGPSGELRMRLVVPIGRFAPYLSVGTQHAVLPDRTRILGASGTDTQWSARHEWTPKASLGLAVVCTRSLALDLGVDLAWVDAPRTISLPGFHLGVLFGGGPRGAQR